MKFPVGFKWGSATSAHQIEGNNYNDWSEWEKARPEEFRSGKACDSYNRYEEDFDIAKKLNQNIHRFSIEWSRIEPKEGRFDHEAMHHYVNVVKALRERGIEPMVTLWHFTNPVWFAEKGGFLKDRVGLWITFNEATTTVASNSYLKGIWPPEKRNIFDALKFRRNIIKAHTLAYQEIKNIYNVPQSLQGPALGTSHNVEVGISEFNFHFVAGKMFGWTSKMLNNLTNNYAWNNTMSYCDFLALQYYTIFRLPGSFSGLPKQLVMEEMGWEIYPKGIYHRLMELKKLKKPIFVTENGIADGKDKLREKFIKEHLRWVWQAIRDGADVRGYMYWSLLDNFEWARGYGPRFGLVEVDFKTFERKIRPSALEYAKICRENKL
ncbi:MAG: glycoside hydrolase family 1 protein [Candidatus Yanofskybacteria bacterium]|nr:glycoside hydrolase family 1 protein [Candidatus Yanofskybacteria bacterium]